MIGDEALVTAVPDHEELLRRARALKPLLAKHAAETEALKRIHPESMAALKEAGLFRMLAPRRFGGYQMRFREVVEVLTAVAEGCGSSGFVTTYRNFGAWMSAIRSNELQREIFANGPDVGVCGSSSPTPDVRRVDGGYVVSGSWASMSGSADADWAGVFMLLPRDDGPPVVAEAMVPMSELTIEDTWHVVGMRGTASETVVAKDVFVPEHRLVEMWRLQRSDFHDYPTEHKDEWLYRAPLHPVLALAVCIAPIGLAQGVLDLAIERAATRPLSGTSFSRQADSTSFQIEMSDAAMLVDTARLHLYRAAEDIDRWAERGEVMEPRIRARVRADVGWAQRHACESIDRVLSAVGAGTFAEASPFQRHWRDANVAARHGAGSYVLNRELYGKVLLGVPVDFIRLAV